MDSDDDAFWNYESDLDDEYKEVTDANLLHEYIEDFDYYDKEFYYELEIQTGLVFAIF